MSSFVATKAKAADSRTEITKTAEFTDTERGDVLHLGDTRAVVVETISGFIGMDSRIVATENNQVGQMICGITNDEQHDKDDPDGGVMWTDDVPEDGGTVDTSLLVAEYGEIYVGENDMDLIYEWVPTHSERQCPNDDEHNSQFLGKTVRDGRIHELYKCLDSDDDCNAVYQYTYEFPEATTAAIHCKPDDDTEHYQMIHGVYERRETDDMSSIGGFAEVACNDDDTPKGVYTAQEVAEFVNAKMNADGEAERFGYVEFGGIVVGKYDGWGRDTDNHDWITWRDDNGEGFDSEWISKVQFEPVNSIEEIETDE